MLKALREFFEQNVLPEDDPKGEEHRVRVATAVLLLEMSRQDEEVTAGERDAIERAVREKFGLDEGEARELIALAEHEARDATDYFEFTRLINDTFSAEQKRRVVEWLWRVAYADGEIDRYEEHMVRKVAELLYLPHSDFIAAKLRAREAEG